MGWQSWTLSEWNDALVKAVFLDTERLAMKITRIPASDRFLAECTGDPAADHRKAARNFISSFGTRDWEIRGHFSWSKSIQRETQRRGHPSVFAPLYLTLLAATADETTFDEGNFRNRFVSLLKPVTMASPPSFAPLSQLWEHVQEWSKARAKKSGDCRVLILPERYHEKLIGYSKRLAFPTFNDETQLQRLLQQRGLGRDAGFRVVAEAVSRREAVFSQPFREEFRLFRELVAAACYEKAYDSPFWGAIQAITWDEDRSASAEAGIFRLGADVSDPSRPELYLLTDETGRKTLGPALACRSLGARGQHMYSVEPPKGQSWTPQLLASLAASRHKLSRAALWKRLNAGCLALFPDSHGNLTLDGEHFDGAPACLLVEGRFGTDLAETAKSLQLKMTEAKADGLFGTWKVILFGELSLAALERLALGLPDPARAAMVPAWRPPRVSCSGGAWYGQSLLLNPASSPVFTLPDASHGSYEAYGCDGEAVSHGNLDEEDTGYQIPPAAIAALAGAETLTVCLRTASGISASSSYPLVQQVPIGRPVQLADPEVWLTDGRDGMLQGLGAQGQATGLVPPNPRKNPAMPRLGTVADAGLPAVANVAAADIAEPLGWLGEALSLRFQRRPTLSFRDLYRHISPAAAAAGTQRWLIKRLLLSSGWLVKIQRTSSPFAVVAPSRGTIAVLNADSPATARIAGMFSSSELAHLSGTLLPEESAWRAGSLRGTLGVGAIELQLSSPERVSELAKELGLSILRKEDFGLPLLPPRQLRQDFPASFPSIPRQAGLEAWHRLQHKWVPAEAPGKPFAAGSTLRFRGAQRYMYWVATGEGYLYTDSEAWAFILAIAAVGQEIGHIAAHGQCLFSPDVESLPLALVQWWMHWGGGYVGIKPCGGLYLAGDGGHGLWAELGDWLPQQPKATEGTTRNLAALERRRLALRLRTSRGSPYNYQE